MKRNYAIIVATFIVLMIAIVQFMLLNPVGITVGYKLSGGRAPTCDESNRESELLRDYEEQLSTYIKYKDSENITAKQWAESAKQKANEIAVEYNNISNENLLKEIN